ncbi:MAG: hypothetical protein PHU85_10585 [Phycisphaerae bacterium]|nr:hypothetical protein [Phycisphaerae bacterium]
MLAGFAVDLHDRGLALSNIIEALLRRARRRGNNAGVPILKAALEMPDCSPHRLVTPVKKVGGNWVEVGDTVIVVAASRPARRIPRSGLRITLSVSGGTVANARKKLRGRRHESLASFVAQLVQFRAGFEKRHVRDWLQTLGWENVA